MIFDYSLAALVTAGLLFYLTYALLRPRAVLTRMIPKSVERFSEKIMRRQQGLRP